MNDKSSITFFLLKQAEDCLVSATVEGSSRRIDKEVQVSININLLLGITLEGVINEIGEYLVDSWTWKRLERADTSLKWRIISGLKEGFSTSGEPLQTISRLQKKRNDIVHPKPKTTDGDLIRESEEGDIAVDFFDETVLPLEYTNVYLGFKKSLEEYNYNDSKKDMLLTLNAILMIMDKLELKDYYPWVHDKIKSIKKIEVPQRKPLT